jgi:hypothetical protein
MCGLVCRPSRRAAGREAAMCAQVRLVALEALRCGGQHERLQGGGGGARSNGSHVRNVNLRAFALCCVHASAASWVPDLSQACKSQITKSPR